MVGRFPGPPLPRCSQSRVGDEIRTQYERKDSRLRVVYDNGTESDVLQRSFQTIYIAKAQLLFLTILATTVNWSSCMHNKLSG